MQSSPAAPSLNQRQRQSVALSQLFPAENDMSRFTGLAILAVLAQAVLGQISSKVRAESTDAATTFNKHIAPIVFQHCADCHRPGEVAPFPLLGYDDVKKRAEQIQLVTQDQFMPPWKSVEGHGQ